MTLVMTDNAITKRRKKVNIRVRKDPRWKRAFETYELRIALAEAQDDWQMYNYLRDARSRLLILCRRQLMKETRIEASIAEKKAQTGRSPAKG